MPPMPYHLEKGPMFSVIEDYVNGDAARAVAMLASLRIDDPDHPDHVPLWELAPFSSTNLAGKPDAPYWQDFRDRWLGLGPQGQAASMWDQYEGDVEAITRRSMRHALEIALGIDVDQPVPDSLPPPRHWPIDLYWKCGQSWFEGWISYRRAGDGPRDGHVDLIFATPSDGSWVLGRPADAPELFKGPDFAVDPTSTRAAAGTEHVAGMRVVTHRHNRTRPPITIQLLPIGATVEIVLNPTIYRGELEIVTVHTGETDGGVLNQPRPYQPPPPT